MNDITNIDSKASMIIYADDTSIFFSGSDISEIIETGNIFLEKLNVWTSLNFLIINSTKTKAVDFRAKGVKVIDNQALTLGSCTIEIVENLKTLGIIFNEYTRWDETTNMIAKKLSKVVGIIYIYKTTLPPSVL